MTNDTITIGGEDAKDTSRVPLHTHALVIVVPKVTEIRLFRSERAGTEISRRLQSQSF